MPYFVNLHILIYVGGKKNKYPHNPGTAAGAMTKNKKRPIFLLFSDAYSTLMSQLLLGKLSTDPLMCLTHHTKVNSRR